MNRALIILCFYFSGAAALIYQVVWLRLLVVELGAALHAVSTVLSSFMAGLALGALLVGRMLDRKPANPLRLYGVLEIAIGLSAYLTYGAIKSLHHLSQGRLILAFFIILVPTLLMGATLPVVARYFTEQADTVGRDVGQLYSANTLGGVLGTVGAGFFLISGYGLFISSCVAVVLNLLAGAVALVLSRKSLAFEPQRTEEPKSASHSRTILLAYGLSGCVALGFEVVWTRMLVTIMGTSVYAFTTMLVVFLLGIAAGSGLISSRTDRLTEPVFALAGLLAGSGLCGLFALWLLPHLPRLMFSLGPRLDGFGSYLLLQILLASLILLPQTLFFGATFPVVTRLVTGRLEHLAGNLGKAYFFNTGGAIFGSLLAGFWLIPRYGPATSAIILGLASLGAGVALALRTGFGFRLGMWTVPPAVLLLLTAQPWRPELTLMSPYAIPKQLASKSYDEHQAQISAEKIVYEGFGLHSTVVVSESPSSRSLSLDGWVVASTHKQDMFIQEALGYFPWIMASDAEDALVVGLGTGVTAASLARMQTSADSLTVVELESAVLEANTFFHEYSHPIQGKGVEIVIADGRTFVSSGARESYDIITSDPIHPFSRGSASLYTVEHFRNCRARLKPDGVVVQWLPLYGLSEVDVKIVIASFLEVFPEASYWCWFPVQTKTDSLLMARMDGKPINYRALENRLKACGEDSPWGSAEELLAGFLMSGERLADYASGVTLNTDDRPILEFTTPLSIYQRDSESARDLALRIIDASGDQLPELENLDYRRTADLADWMRRGARPLKSYRLENSKNH